MVYRKSTMIIAGNADISYKNIVRRILIASLINLLIKIWKSLATMFPYNCDVISHLAC